MAEFEKKAHAASRGLEDAKAANALTLATGQTLVLINGGAATATLTFFAAVYGSAKSGSMPFEVPVLAIALSLFSFAIGVVFGASVLGYQGQAVQFWSRYYDCIAGTDEIDKKDQHADSGWRCNVKVGICFKSSVVAFAVGILILGGSLVWGQVNPKAAVPQNVGSQPALKSSTPR